MSELSNIDKVAAQKKVSGMSAKPQVSIDRAEKKEEIGALNEIKKYEIELEQADHAFALMTEIRERLETAFQEISEN